jgi:hypothetical protein
MEIGIVRHRVLDLRADVLRRVMLQPDDGRAQQLDAVLRAIRGQRQRVGACSLAYDECGDSRPIQTHETPSSTSSLHGILAIALADENTYSDQACPCLHAVEQFHGAPLVQQEVLVHDEERMHASRIPSRHGRKSSAPVFVEVEDLPLPPKNADVVQKLQPMGHPTEGMMVAAVEPLFPAAAGPSRPPKPETISRMLDGRVSSSPRKRRIQEMPSPRTM